MHKLAKWYFPERFVNGETIKELFSDEPAIEIDQRTDYAYSEKLIKQIMEKDYKFIDENLRLYPNCYMLYNLSKLAGCDTASNLLNNLIKSEAQNYLVVTDSGDMIINQGTKSTHEKQHIQEQGKYENTFVENLEPRRKTKLDCVLLQDKTKFQTILLYAPPYSGKSVLSLSLDSVYDTDSARSLALVQNVNVDGVILTNRHDICERIIQNALNSNRTVKLYIIVREFSTSFLKAKIHEYAGSRKYERSVISHELARIMMVPYFDNIDIARKLAILSDDFGIDYEVFIREFSINNKNIEINDFI